MPFGTPRSRKADDVRVTDPQYDPTAPYPRADPDLTPAAGEDVGAPLEHPREYVVEPAPRRRAPGTVGALLAGMAVGGAVAGALAYVNRQNRGLGRAAAPADPPPSGADRPGDESPSRVSGSVLASLPAGEPIAVSEAIDIDVRPALVYAQWRRLENLPQILSHLEVVREETATTSYWQAKGPAGTTVSWYATLDADVPAERLAWSSDEGADVPNAGVVTFSPVNAGMGTRLSVDLTYTPPAGKLGRLVAAAFGEAPAQQVSDDLRNFRDAVQAVNRGARASA